VRITSTDETNCEVKPKLLDLFSGAGGAGYGYHLAGFELLGIDISPQPNYPFRFLQMDALSIDVEWARETFDAVHASPPCQAYSRLRHLPWLKGREYPELIDATRELLRAIGKPWIIENVMDAPLKWGATVCGEALGRKGLSRHRRFESSEVLLGTLCLGHETLASGSASLGKRYTTGVTGVKEISRSSIAGHVTGWREAARIMEIDWMTRDELTQAIPPCYTEYLGEQLLAYLPRPVG
jgi:DNA (cytosine-5)-methyltransferase 1